MRSQRASTRMPAPTCSRGRKERASRQALDCCSAYFNSGEKTKIALGLLE